MKMMDVYNRLPVWGQNLACFYEGKRIVQTRYSKNFWQFLNEYENRNNWSYEQLCDYRDKRLQKMIKHCYKTVPYYTKLFDEGGIPPNSIKTISDLEVLPILTKDMVKQNIDSLISSIIPRKTIKIHATGGTTGAGLNFRTSNIEEAEQWAVWWRYRRRHGIRSEDWCANFGGKTIVPLSINKPPYWRINKPGKQIFYSSYHLNEDTSDMYAKSLRENEISWIHGYPSNIAVLASEFNRKNFFFPVRWVTTGAENLYTSQAKEIM
jgi:phenylacetate-CoA ligase